MELIGRAVLKIQRLGGAIAYGTTTPLPDGSPMAGKSYFRYKYIDKVFIVNSEDKFNADFDKGTVYTVDLTEDEEKQLSFANHTTISQEINVVKTELLLQSFKMENVKIDFKEVLDAIQ